MKQVKGSRGWIAAAFTILFTVGLIAVRTKAAIQPSGEAPSTLPAPVLSAEDQIACGTTGLDWTSVTGATSYQIWRGVGTTYNEIWYGTGNFLVVGVPPRTIYGFKAVACNAQGCSGFSNQVTVKGVGPPCP
jgi:hypothetical protein